MEYHSCDTAEPDLARFGGQHTAVFDSLFSSLVIIAFVIYASLECSQLLEWATALFRILMSAHPQGVSDRGLSSRPYDVS